jgi:hypothetical protein
MAPGRRGAALLLVAAALLAAPAVLAFFSGGYFATGAQAGLVAAIAAWMVVALVAVMAPAPLPRSTPGRVCVAGLAGLAAWTAISLAWTPTLDPGLADAERVFLYLAVLVAAAASLRTRALARAVEPALAAGVLVVCAYALATRLLPELVPSTPGLRAQTRLDQPLTYWNALGALAAMGIALALRVASDAARPTKLRAAATGSVPPMVLTLFLTVSRGGVVAAAAGAAALFLLVRDRRTLASIALGGGLGALACVVAARFDTVVDLAGSDSARQSDGLIVLAVLLALSALAIGGQASLVRRGLATAAIPFGRRGRLLAGLAVAAAVVAVVGAVVAGSSEEAGSGSELPQGVERFASVKSNRYDYWGIALSKFRDRPLQGQGAHGFANIWLKEREIREGAQDAHSLYIETLVELGLVGVLLLACFLGGAVVCLAHARRGPDGPELTSGWAAAGVVWLTHAAVDWDWEMPALTLVFVLLVGCAVAAADGYAAAAVRRPSAAATDRRPATASSPTAPSTISEGSAATRKRVTP